MPAHPLVLLDRDAAIATLTLNRPAMLNALVPELLRDFLTALQHIRDDDSIRAVVLAATGSAFSIGGDMRRFAQEGQRSKTGLLAYSAELVGLLNESILAMAGLPKPIIAAIHGTVTGGSIAFAAGADLVVLADDAVLKAHYVSAGFCPDGGWSAAIAGLIGTRRAAAALLLNQSIPARQALEWGLANEIVPAGEVIARAHAMANRLAAYPVGTLRWTKRLLAGKTTDLAFRLEAERQGFLALIGEDSTLAEINRFLTTFTTYPGTTGS